MTKAVSHAGDTNIEKLTKELEIKLGEVSCHAPAEKIEKRHNKGQFTARERINKLGDGGGFHETVAQMVHRCVDFGMNKM